MNEEKIKKLEEEIKNIYLNHKSDKFPKDSPGAFWFIHVSAVISHAKRLVEKYGGDREVVWTAAILHDIGQLEALEPHEEIGAEKALAMLTERGFEADFAQKVEKVILTHRVNKHEPENQEQKILATADALTHFTTPHYIWVGHSSVKSLEELLEKFSEKVERDFHDKIFFEEEKETVRREYEVLKNWFSNFEA